MKPISRLVEVVEVAFNVRRRMWIRKAIPSGKRNVASQEFKIVDFAISRNFNRGSFRDGRSYNVPEANRAEPINGRCITLRRDIARDGRKDSGCDCNYFMGRNHRKINTGKTVSFETGFYRRHDEKNPSIIKIFRTMR